MNFYNILSSIGLAVTIIIISFLITWANMINKKNKESFMILEYNFIYKILIVVLCIGLLAVLIYLMFYVTKRQIKLDDFIYLCIFLTIFFLINIFLIKEIFYRKIFYNENEIIYVKFFKRMRVSWKDIKKINITSFDDIQLCFDDHNKFSISWGLTGFLNFFSVCKKRLNKDLFTLSHIAKIERRLSELHGRFITK